MAATSVEHIADISKPITICSEAENPSTVYKRYFHNLPYATPNIIERTQIIIIMYYM